MRIDRAGIPFIVGALLPAGVLAVAGHPRWGVPLGIIAAFCAFFFRDPDRITTAAGDVVVAPADGRVLHAGVPEPGLAPAGQWRQVSIFLSLLDVHVNRAPVSGRVLDVRYSPGRFFPAYRQESGRANEHSEVWIDHGGQTIVCRQVVGILARRVVCRLVTGMDVGVGQRFGIMKFGSRMDVFVPLSATLRVERGEYVRGGETIIASLVSCLPQHE